VSSQKTNKIIAAAFVTFLIVMVMVDIYHRRRLEARFQEGLQEYFNQQAPVAAPAGAAPPAAPAQPAAVPVPVAEPEAVQVVEDIAPEQPAPIQPAVAPGVNGAAPAAEPAVMAGNRPVTEGMLEGPLV
jgi:hypothetical protein